MSGTQQQPYENHGYNPYAPPTPGAESSMDPSYGLADEHILAGRGTRLGAALIDGCLMMAAIMPGMALLMTSMDRIEDLDRMGNFFGALALMGAGVLALSAYQWYLISMSGQSLAKRWLGIKIVKIDGEPCGFVHGVILRLWVMGAIGQVPLIGAIAALVNPLMIFGEERRCLHDMIAGTKVVLAPE